MIMRRALAGTVAVVTFVGLMTASTRAADAPTIEWALDTRSSLHDVVTDGAGGAIVVGETPSGAARIRHVGPTGETIWVDTYSPEPASSGADAVAIAPDGTTVAAGWIWCLDEDHPEAGGMFARALDADGSVLWTVGSNRGSCAGRERATDVVIAHDMVVVVGLREGCCGIAADDGWVRAFDMDGELLWHRNFEVAGVDRRKNDGANTVVSTSEGFVVAGYIYGRLTNDTATPNDQEVALQALDPTGAVLWTSVWRDRNTVDHDSALSAASNGNSIILGGMLEGSWYGHTPQRGFVAKLRLDGSVRWRRTWRDHTQVDGVSVASDGTVWAAGTVWPDRFDANLLLRGYNLRGRLGWEIRRGGPRHDVYPSAVCTDDLGAFMTGDNGGTKAAGRLWRLSDPRALA